MQSMNCKVSRPLGCSTPDSTTGSFRTNHIFYLGTIEKSLFTARRKAHIAAGSDIQTTSICEHVWQHEYQSIFLEVGGLHLLRRNSIPCFSPSDGKGMQSFKQTGTQLALSRPFSSARMTLHLWMVMASFTLCTLGTFVKTQLELRHPRPATRHVHDGQPLTMDSIQEMAKEFLEEMQHYKLIFTKRRLFSRAALNIFSRERSRPHAL